MNKLLADRDIICSGPFCNQLRQGTSPTDLASTLMGTIVQWVLVAGGLLLLFFLLSASLEWITSGGEKEKIQKAQQKITWAVIGMVFLAVSYSVWLIIVVDVLGIFGKGGSFSLPTFGQP